MSLIFRCQFRKAMALLWLDSRSGYTYKILFLRLMILSILTTMHSKNCLQTFSETRHYGAVIFGAETHHSAMLRKRAVSAMLYGPRLAHIAMCLEDHPRLHLRRSSVTRQHCDVTFFTERDRTNGGKWREWIRAIQHFRECNYTRSTQAWATGIGVQFHAHVSPEKHAFKWKTRLTSKRSHTFTLRERRKNCRATAQQTAGDANLPARPNATILDLPVATDECDLRGLE